MISLFAVSCGTNYDKPITAQDECPSQEDLLEAEKRIDLLKAEPDYVPKYMSKPEYVSLTESFSIACSLGMIDGYSPEGDSWVVEYREWLNESEYYSIDSLSRHFDAHCRNLSGETDYDSAQSLQYAESGLDSLLLGVYSRNPDKNYMGLSCENGLRVESTVGQDFKNTERFANLTEEGYTLTEDKVVEIGIPDEIADKYL